MKADDQKLADEADGLESEKDDDDDAKPIKKFKKHN